MSAHPLLTVGCCSLLLTLGGVARAQDAGEHEHKDDHTAHGEHAAEHGHADEHADEHGSEHGHADDHSAHGEHATEHGHSDEHEHHGEHEPMVHEGHGSHAGHAGHDMGHDHGSHAGHGGHSGGHHGHHGHGDGMMVHAMLSARSGTVEAFGSSRDYQGGELMAGVMRGDFELMMHLPLHRLELGANTSTGVGDMHIMVNWVAHRMGATQLGVMGGAMPPLGDDEQGLGMGHWMVMAGGFARSSVGRFNGELKLNYGGATSAGAHAEHGVLSWPPVDPMNGHELRTKLNVGTPLAYGIGAAVNGMVAVPLGDGETLAMAGGDLTYSLDAYTLAIGVKQGLANHTAGTMLGTHVMGMF